MDEKTPNGGLSWSLDSGLPWDVEGLESVVSGGGVSCPGLSSRSSVVILKRNAPKMEPWGTPPFTAQGVDHSWSNLTDMVRMVRKVASSSRKGVLAPLRAKAYFNS